MTQETTVQVLGLDQLRKNLDALGEKLAVKGMRSGLRVAGRVFLEAMRQYIHRTGGKRPVDKQGRERRHLADSLRTRMKVNKYGDAKATIGPTRALQHIANWLEFGTGPHIIKAKKGKALLIAGANLVFEVHHPGAAAEPFIRPAFDTCWERALETFKTELAKFIEKRS